MTRLGTDTGTGMPRISQLDSLRGIMALIVVIQHMYLSLPDEIMNSWGKLFKFTPLRVFVAGHASVLVFFVMSGFVLALPFCRGRAMDFPVFLVKRACRLYPPFAVAVLLAALAYGLAGGGPVGAASAWVFENWKDPLSASLVIDNLVGLGREQDINLNGPLWSLILELRIALIFPLLLLIVARFGAASLALGVTILVGMNILLPALGEAQYMYVSAKTVTGSLLVTLRYSGFFIAGIYMASTLDAWSGWVRRLDIRQRLALTLACLALLAAPSTYAQVSDLIIGAGAAGLVAITIAFGAETLVLTAAPVRWLGRVSYSLYLIHMPLWLVVVHQLFERIGIVASSALYLAVVLLCAEAMYRTVEHPSILLGQWATRQLAQRRGTNSALAASRS